MLVIRRDQMDGFAEATFTRLMPSHLREHFPAATAGRDDTDLRDWICRGLARARAHGLATAVGWCQYLDLMMALGEDFDQRADCHWAAGILADPAAEPIRMRRLCDAAIDYLMAIAEHDRC